jgi:hypothetical protein
MKSVATKKGKTTNFFSPLSFVVAVFGSGIRVKHPGSATRLPAIMFMCLYTHSIDYIWGSESPLIYR